MLRTARGKASSRNNLTARQVGAVTLVAEEGDNTDLETLFLYPGRLG